jgi:HD-GYP domain-containing protein (c-di-GMP phosphodiesterase class II)
MAWSVQRGRRTPNGEKRVIASTERVGSVRALGAALTGAGLVSLAWGLDALRREHARHMLHRRMVELLLNTLTAGDPVTARHSRRVADLSYALGVAIGMPRREQHTLRVAALLHDMGKLDDRFFHIVHSRKPLTDDERERIQYHPHESAHILAPLEPNHPGLREIVSSHHECWNGDGYPRGLAGEQIPLGARIIAVADAFDAMTQPRKYRGELSVPDALAEVRRDAGTHFDPALVRALHEPSLVERWTEIARRGVFAERPRQAAEEEQEEGDEERAARA